MGSNENIAKHGNYKVTTFTINHIDDAINTLMALKNKYIEGSQYRACIDRQVKSIKLDISLAIDNMKLQVRI
jgi:hypothetical protein